MVAVVNDPQDTAPRSMASMGHAQASYAVTPTGGDYGNLPPITLSISQGAWHFQDYLTLEEAELLAGTLRACARRLREERDAERDEVLRDLEIVSRAARTPYTPEAASVIERCDHCERVFDETEDPFIGPTGGDLCAHCAATWLGEERTRLADQLTGAVRDFERITKLAAWIYRDRREPDKVIAYAQEIACLAATERRES